MTGLVAIDQEIHTCQTTVKHVCSQVQRDADMTCYELHVCKLLALYANNATKKRRGRRSPDKSSIILKVSNFESVEAQAQASPVLRALQPFLMS